CRPVGAACAANSDCCNDVHVNFNGNCSSTTGTCGGPYAACSPGAQHCANGLTCIGHCSNISPVRRCQTSTDCDGGLCIEFQCDDGRVCSFDSDCNLFPHGSCVGHHCVYAPS